MTAGEQECAAIVCASLIVSACFLPILFQFSSEGTFYAVLSETHKISLTRSALVGEMSYWEGGIRTADIVVASDSDGGGSGGGGGSSGGGVLAVISFEDLRRLQRVDGELAAKFLHLLAVVSIRKLRNMLKNPASAASNAGTASSAATTAGEAAAAVPMSPSFAPATAPSQTGATPALSGTDGSASAVAAKESLFLTRLRKEASEAQASAAKALVRTSRLTKAKRDTEYRAANLENRLRALERELDDSQAECRRQGDAARSARERVRHLEEQLATSLARAAELDSNLARLQSEHSHALAEHSTLLATHHEHVSRSNHARGELEGKLAESVAQSESLRARLGEVDKALAATTAAHEDLLQAKQSLDRDSSHRLSLSEIEALRTSLTLAEQRAAALESLRRELVVRLDQEALALASSKAKADLHLGDYTRLQTTLRENCEAVLDAQGERRGALRLLGQAQALLKKLIVRNFVRSARTRKMIFAIFARVNHVSTARLEAEGEVAADTDGSSSSTRFGGAMVSTTQSVSLRQMRRDRTRLMAFLRAERTPVSKLVWLLDEELTAFESPFLALQTENKQLRHTLDAFFQRNVALMAQFSAAKTTYESLHAEYARLKASWERLQRREKARMAASAADGAQAGVSFDLAAAQQQTTPQQQQTPQLLHGEEQEEEEAPPASFAPTFPAPPPFAPAAASAAALRSHAHGAGYASVFGGEGSRAATPHQHRQSSGQSRPASSASHQQRPTANPSPPAASPVRPAGMGSPRASRPGTSASSARGHAHGGPNPPMSPLASASFDGWQSPEPHGHGHGYPPASSDVAARSQALRERIHSLTAATAGGPRGSPGRPSSSPHARPSPPSAAGSGSAAHFPYSHGASAASPSVASGFASGRLMSPSGAFYEPPQPAAATGAQRLFSFAPQSPQRPGSGVGHGHGHSHGGFFAEEKSPRFQQQQQQQQPQHHHQQHPQSARPASSLHGHVNTNIHSPAAAAAAHNSPYPHVQHHAHAHSNSLAGSSSPTFSHVHAPMSPQSAQSYDKLFARR